MAMQRHRGKRNILVTGGAGFLGSHLVDELIARGARVVVLDSFVTGSSSNLDHLRDNPNLMLIHHDVREPFPILSDEMDEIYHLACPASPPQYQKDPIKTLDTCYLGTRNALEFAANSKARFLLASTSEIYGDPLVHPQPETYYGNVLPHGPRSCYDEGKRVAESLCWAYKCKHGADIRIARIFNVYGPRMSPLDGRVVSNFIIAALAGRNLEIAGDGHATRTFQYVSDCTEGLIRLMNSNYGEQPIDIGSDCDELSVADLAAKIQEIVAGSRCNPRISFLRRRTNDPVQRRADISQARKVLGWYPIVPLEEGLRKTIAWASETDSPVLVDEVISHDRSSGQLAVQDLRSNTSNGLSPSRVTSSKLTFLDWVSLPFKKRIA